ncbi:UCN3 protein, partial [Chroicocephalus maculipennis]|nr:UCN3 protein [Chroicocephalus maculipennis]
MANTRLLLLLALLCAAETSWALRLYNAASIFSCLNTALAEAQKSLPEENAILDKRGFESPSPEEVSEEE